MLVTKPSVRLGLWLRQVRMGNFGPGCAHLLVPANRFNTYFCNCIFVIFLVSRKRHKRGQSSLSYQLQLQWLTLASTFNQHSKEPLGVTPASSAQLVSGDSWNHRHRIVQACGGHPIQSHHPLEAELSPASDHVSHVSVLQSLGSSKARPDLLQLPERLPRSCTNLLENILLQGLSPNITNCKLWPLSLAAPSGTARNSLASSYSQLPHRDS